MENEAARRDQALYLGALDATKRIAELEAERDQLACSLGGKCKEVERLRGALQTVHDWVYERGYYDVWEDTGLGQAVLNKMNAALEPAEPGDGWHIGNPDQHKGKTSG